MMVTQGPRLADVPPAQRSASLVGNTLEGSWWDFLKKEGRKEVRDRKKERKKPNVYENVERWFTQTVKSLGINRWWEYRKPRKLKKKKQPKWSFSSSEKTKSCIGKNITRVHGKAHLSVAFARPWAWNPRYCSNRNYNTVLWAQGCEKELNHPMP